VTRRRLPSWAPLAATLTLVVGCAGGVDPVTGELLGALGSALGAPVAVAAGARAAADQPDAASGYQLHALYVLPRDGVDRGLDTDGTLGRSIGAFEAWFAGQTGGKQRLRVDRTAAGAVDVSCVRLDETDAQLRTHGATQRDAIEAALKRKGWTEPKKLYLVYYEGTHGTACGDGPHPPGLPGNAVVLYLKAVPAGARPCDDNGWTPDGAKMTYREQSMIHEVLHALGFTPACAPHQTRGGHTSIDPTDIMYAGDQPWRPTRLDVAGEIYGHGRAGCLDLAKSAFLEPAAADAAPPPRWERAVTSR